MGKKSRITTRNRENKVNIWKTNPTYQRIAEESFIMPLLSRPRYAPSSLLATLTPSLPCAWNDWYYTHVYWWIGGGGGDGRVVIWDNTCWKFRQETRNELVQSHCYLLTIIREHPISHAGAPARPVTTGEQPEVHGGMDGVQVLFFFWCNLLGVRGWRWHWIIDGEGRRRGGGGTLDAILELPIQVKTIYASTFLLLAINDLISCHNNLQLVFAFLGHNEILFTYSYISKQRQYRMAAMKIMEIKGG